MRFVEKLISAPTNAHI